MPRFEIQLAMEIVLHPKVDFFRDKYEFDNFDFVSKERLGFKL